jgi:hypothetical protein
MKWFLGVSAIVAMTGSIGHWWAVSLTAYSWLFFLASFVGGIGFAMAILSKRGLHFLSRFLIIPAISASILGWWSPDHYQLIVVNVSDGPYVVLCDFLIATLYVVGSTIAHKRASSQKAPDFNEKGE